MKKAFCKGNENNLFPISSLDSSRSERIQLWQEKFKISINFKNLNAKKHDFWDWLPRKMYKCHHQYILKAFTNRPLSGIL